jgi:hypothetical protein
MYFDGGSGTVFTVDNYGDIYFSGALVGSGYGNGIVYVDGTQFFTNTPNITTTPMFLTQTGNGTDPFAPVFSVLTSANLPQNYVAANQAIATGATITINHTAPYQILRVDGSTGARTASTTPFGTSPPLDGTVIVLIGTNSTSTLTIPHNDAANGCILLSSASAILIKYSTLTLVYDSTQQRYIETARKL